MNITQTVNRRLALKAAIAGMSSWLGSCGGTQAQQQSGIAPPEATLPPPSWADSAASGTWVAVPMATTLSAVDPIQSPAFNPNHPSTPEWALNTLRQQQVVLACCGAAYDEGGDTMWLGLGGGHQDYAGNEIYKCDFSAEAPAWQMVRPPSGAVGNLLTTNDGQEASGVYADGRPRAVHGYNKWVYVPGVGPVLMPHGLGSWSSSNGRTWGVFVDKTSGEHAFTAVPGSISINNTTGSGCAYDPSRHAIWVVQKNTTALVRYDIPSSGGAHAGSFTPVGASWARLAQVSACHIPGHDVLLIGQSNGNTHADSTTQTWAVFDCATAVVTTPAFNGALAGGMLAGFSQPRWVPSLGAACVWDNTSNTTLITRLTPGANPRTDAWAVDTLPVSGSNSGTPAPAANNGTFGRFAYSARLGGFVVFSSTAGPTYFYKL